MSPSLATASEGFIGFFGRLVAGPWREDPEAYLWIGLMALCIGVACGLTGLVLVLRRSAMMGDAISHSVLPGLVVAFLLSGGTSSTAMFAGALAAGLATSGFVQLLRQVSPIKQDAAIGIAFSTLFAVGVVLITLFADSLHLDTDAVLLGELLFVPLEPPLVFAGWEIAPLPVVRMAALACATCGLIAIFRRHWMTATFDPGLARTLGFRPRVIHYAIMAWTALVVVGAFEAVGAITVIAMLVLPAATALLLADRLPRVIPWILAHVFASTLLGLHLSWAADASAAASIVVAGAALFSIAWLATRMRVARDTKPTSV
jgi:manganese/zinc/iron transport system permease protein